MSAAEGRPLHQRSVLERRLEEWRGGRVATGAKAEAEAALPFHSELIFECGSGCGARQSAADSRTAPSQLRAGSALRDTLRRPVARSHEGGVTGASSVRVGKADTHGSQCAVLHTALAASAACRLPIHRLSHSPHGLVVHRCPPPTLAFPYRRKAMAVLYTCGFSLHHRRATITHFAMQPVHSRSQARGRS